MATKTITIMEDVYKLLRLAKRADESFSDTLRRKLVEKKDIMQFAGAWRDMSDSEAEAMKRDIRAMRKRSTKALLRRVRSWEK